MYKIYKRMLGAHGKIIVDITHFLVVERSYYYVRVKYININYNKLTLL